MRGPAVNDQPVNSYPLNPQVLGGCATMQKFQQVLDILGKLGGKPPTVAADEFFRRAIAEVADPDFPRVVASGH